MLSIDSVVKLIEARGLSVCRATVRSDALAGYLKPTARTRGRGELLFLPEDAEAYAEQFMTVRGAQADRQKAAGRAQ